MITYKFQISSIACICFVILLLPTHVCAQTITATIDTTFANPTQDSLHVSPTDTFQIAVYGDNLPPVFSVAFTLQYDPSKIAYSHFNFHSQTQRSMLYENIALIPEESADHLEQFVQNPLIEVADSGAVTLYLSVKDTIGSTHPYYHGTGLLGVITFQAKHVPKPQHTNLILKDRKLAYLTVGLIDPLPGEESVIVTIIPQYAGDFNTNGCIDFWDFISFAQRMNPLADYAWDARFDLNNDEHLSFPDLLILLENFGKCNH